MQSADSTHLIWSGRLKRSLIIEMQLMQRLLEISGNRLTESQMLEMH